RLELKLDIETALERGELHLVYQPIVTLGDSRTIGVEALLRWQHPRLGSVSPLEFITLAEESGAIVPIGESVIEDASRQAVAWEREFSRPLDVSVNVSVRQLERPEFPARVAAALTPTGIDPARVPLEIPETAVAREGMALQIIEELAALGLRLAIDDFGIG